MKRASRRAVSEVLAAAAAPDPGTDERALDAVLAAFRDAGPAERPADDRRRVADAGRPTRRTARSLAVKCALALFVVLGSGFAAAAAGALPAAVQRFAHEHAGGIGIPAPGSSSAAPPPTGTPAAHASGTPSPRQSTATTASASPAALAALCRKVQGDGESWHADLDAADRAALIAAAGTAQQVESYCDSVAPGAAATPDPGVPQHPSPAPPRGKGAPTLATGHAGHAPSPNAHASGH